MDKVTGDRSDNCIYEYFCEKPKVGGNWVKPGEKLGSGRKTGINKKWAKY